METVDWKTLLEHLGELKDVLTALPIEHALKRLDAAACHLVAERIAGLEVGG